MLRPLLALLLLANYLLVVGTGLVVSRPDVPLYSAAHPYVHNKHCQQDHYLRLDCFEQCNGPQQTVKAKLPAGAGLHFLAQLKGLDVHCPHQGLPTWPSRTVFAEAAGTPPAIAVAALPAGIDNQNYPPPQRG